MNVFPFQGFGISSAIQLVAWKQRFGSRKLQNYDPFYSLKRSSTWGNVVPTLHSGSL